MNLLVWPFVNISSHGRLREIEKSLPSNIYAAFHCAEPIDPSTVGPRIIVRSDVTIFMLKALSRNKTNARTSKPESAISTEEENDVDLRFGDLLCHSYLLFYVIHCIPRPVSMSMAALCLLSSKNSQQSSQLKLGHICEQHNVVIR